MCRANKYLSIVLYLSTTRVEPFAVHNRFLNTKPCPYPRQILKVEEAGKGKYMVKLICTEWNTNGHCSAIPAP